MLRCDTCLPAKKQGDELHKQYLETSGTFKALNETLKGLNTWVSKVDDYIKEIQQTLETVGSRLETLEATRPPSANTRTTVAPVEELDPASLTTALKVTVPQRGCS